MFAVAVLGAGAGARTNCTSSCTAGGLFDLGEDSGSGGTSTGFAFEPGGDGSRGEVSGAASVDGGSVLPLEDDLF